MFTATDAVVAGLIPLSLALGVFWLASRAKWVSGEVWLLGVAAGFLSGKLGIDARDRLALQPEDTGPVSQWLPAIVDTLQAWAAPTESRHWLPWFVMAACALPLIVGIVRMYGQRAADAVSACLWLLIAVGLPIRLLWGSVYLPSGWPAGGQWLWIAGLVVAQAALRSSLMSKPSVPEQWSKGALLLMVFFAAAVTLLLTGSKTYAETAAVLAMATVGCVAASSGAKRSWLSPHAAGLITVLFAGVLILGCSFSELHVWQAVVLALSVLVPRWTIDQLGTRWPRALLAALLVAALAAGMVVAVAGWDFHQATTSNPYLHYR